MPRLIFNGRPVEPEELDRDERLAAAANPITAAGAGLPDEDAAYIFASDEEFERFAQKVGVHEKVRVVKQNAAKFKKETFTDRDAQAIRERHDRSKASLDKLAKKLGKPVSSREVLDRWVRENPDKQGAVDPFVGWENPNYGGNWIFPTSASPVMHEWNDRLSSIMMVSAVGMFGEHEWWGGAKLWLFGIPFWGVPDLSTWRLRSYENWDNRISSWALFSG